jgi:hypothetical protein
MGKVANRNGWQNENESTNTIDIDPEGIIFASHA